MNLAELTTEGWRPEWRDIDTRPTLDVVRLLNDEDARVAPAVGAAAPALAVAIDAIVARLAEGGRLLYVGAGTPGRLGLVDAAECGPTFNTRPGQVVGVLAGGDGAMAEATESVEDDAAGGAADLRALSVGPADAVVGISASGRTPYVLGAVGHARHVGALTVGLACNAGSPLADTVDFPVEVVVGPEVLSGSTRLKAGTAQKLMLNTISTVTMVRLGKTYGNLMVDVRATNDKLRERVRRIVAQATGASDPEVAAALRATGHDAKPAIVMLLSGADCARARAALVAAGGRVRDALAALP